MSDPSILIEVWKILKDKKNLVLFIETEEIEEDATVILDWFQPIIECKVSSIDAKMINGSFLCIRKVLNKMPPINSKTLGEYEVKVLKVAEMKKIKEALNE